MLKVCHVCGQEREHAGGRSTTCNDCIGAGLKWCSECGEVKSISMFGRKGKVLNSCCKVCNVSRSKSARKEGYYEAYYNDPSKVQHRREYGMEHYKRNKKAINKHRVEHSRERYHTDEEYRQKRIQQSRMYEATRECTGHVPIDELKVLYGVFDNSCAYCGTAKQLTIDHIVPVSKGGKNMVGNIVPACKSCNSSKGAKDYEEWFKLQEFFDASRLNKIKEVMTIHGH